MIGAVFKTVEPDESLDERRELERMVAAAAQPKPKQKAKPKPAPAPSSSPKPAAQA